MLFAQEKMNLKSEKDEYLLAYIADIWSVHGPRRSPGGPRIPLNSEISGDPKDILVFRTNQDQTSSLIELVGGVGTAGRKTYIFQVVQPCTGDGYTRVDVKCGCMDCYC